MFFAVLCLITAYLLLTGQEPDHYGWMMLVGLGWICGYLDCRNMKKSDNDRDRVYPADMQEPDDSVTYQTDR